MFDLDASVPDGENEGTRFLAGFQDPIMSKERFSNFEFDLSASRHADSGRWVPYLEIRDYSEDHEAGEVIFPRQPIAEDDVFDSEQAAIDEARRFAMAHVSSGEF